MKHVIKTIVDVVALGSRQPYRIGDLIKRHEAEETAVVIGIESLGMSEGNLRISYICQVVDAVIEERNMVSSTPTAYDEVTNSFFAFIPYNQPEALEFLQTGRMVWYKDFPYINTEFLEVACEEKALKVTIRARPVYILSEKDIKRKLLDQKKAKRQLSLVKNNHKENG